MSKVFGIGFHKTGTSSLGKAFEILDYKSCFGANELRAYLGEKTMMQSLFKGEYETIFEFAEEYNAFNDLPWFAIYQALDKYFPNSKFILSIREEEAWLESAKRYFGDTVSPFRLWLYGKPNLVGNEAIYLQRYRKHNEEVIAYFKDRDNLLVLDVAANNKWERICTFLDKPIPKEAYPHFNTGTKR